MVLWPLLAASLFTFAGLTFEVASIRPSNPGSQGLRFDKTPDNGFRATGVTLRFLVQTAYDVEDFQISGGAGWLRSERFDVQARSEDPDKTKLLQAEQFRERMRALLAARFQLSIREESKEGAVYILEQTKNGNKLNQATGGGAGMGRNRGVITTENASVAMLAKTLSATLSRPVLDQTGLTGKYAFKLQWAEEGAPGEPEDSGVSLFTAIQEQLGLRLQPGKAPIRSIRIERAEKPSAN
jgi:bla regulator protein BlaR1